MNMVSIANIRLNNLPFNDFLAIGRNYCSDQLGNFFPNNYSPLAETPNRFDIPPHLANSSQRGFAICVMMNNHIVDLKYFNDIFPNWDKHMENLLNIEDPDIRFIMNDDKLLSVINKFKKLNDEIVIGYCNGLEFTTL